MGWQAKLAEYLIVIAVCLGISYFIWNKGYEACEDKHKIEQAVADKKQQDKYNLVAQELEETKKNREENVRTITKTVAKIVTRDIYRNVECLDADGMSVANQAISGRKIESQPSSTLSTNSTP
jgi:hypothetical protein